MIVGIGIDSIELNKARKMMSLPGFYNWFTEEEIENKHGRDDVYYASRIVCKEAVFKALPDQNGVDLRKISILNDENGRPYVVNKECFGVDNIHISITTTDELVTAFCVIE